MCKITLKMHLNTIFIASREKSETRNSATAGKVPSMIYAVHPCAHACMHVHVCMLYSVEFFGKQSSLSHLVSLPICSAHYLFLPKDYPSFATTLLKHYPSYFQINEPLTKVRLLYLGWSWSAPNELWVKNMQLGSYDKECSFFIVILLGSFYKEI